METNTKRLTMLLRFIDIALVVILISIIISFFYLNTYSDKFSGLSDRMPKSEKFDYLRLSFHWLTWVALLPKIFTSLLYGGVLFYLRKVVKSILTGG
ncbi:MAG: hypothetical protein ACQUHE_17755, partial [Bacteroidia bacterium]